MKNNKIDFTNDIKDWAEQYNKYKERQEDICPDCRRGKKVCPRCGKEYYEDERWPYRLYPVWC